MKFFFIKLKIKLSYNYKLNKVHLNFQTNFFCFFIMKQFKNVLLKNFKNK